MTVTVAGIIPPMVTPFTDDEELDLEALRAEVRFLLASGVHGLTVTGSTGEGQTLTIEESCRIAQVALEETAGRVPVVAGIIQDSTRAVIRYGVALKEVGVAALQITPIHYLFSAGEEGTLAYYTAISQAVQLPIVIYNVVPWNTIPPATLLRLASVAGVVAVKQSGGNIHGLADLLQAVRATGSRLRVLTAIDALLYPSFLLGAHGAVAALLAVVPRQCVALWDACQRRDLDQALAIHDRLLPLWRLLDQPDMSSRVKAAIELQGRRVGPARHPLLPIDPGVREQIRHALDAALAG